jgi:hypothetical protein
LMLVPIPMFLHMRCFSVDYGNMFPPSVWHMHSPTSRFVCFKPDDVCMATVMVS